MDRPVNVGVLVGSLRKASFNGMLAKALISLAPPPMKLDIVEIGQLPLYNADLETQLRPRNGPRSVNASRPLMQFCSSRLNITGRCLPPSRMHWMSVPGRMEAASGTASLVLLSAARRARLEASAPIIISGSRSCFLTYRPCSSPKPMSAMSTSCSINTASSSATAPANSCMRS